MCNGKSRKDGEIRVFKVTIGVLVAADWLKQATWLLGLIFAPCMRPRFINQSENSKFKPHSHRITFLTFYCNSISISVKLYYFLLGGRPASGNSHGHCEAKTRKDRKF